MTMPHLHPDDMQAIIAGVTEMLKPVVQEMLGRERTLATLQTLTVDEVARLTNRDSQTIINHIKKGLLRAKKNGNYIITIENYQSYVNPQ